MNSTLIELETEVSNQERFLTAIIGDFMFILQVIKAARIIVSNSYKVCNINTHRPDIHPVTIVHV